MAVDAHGALLSSAQASESSGWHAIATGVSSPIVGVSCPATSLCVAVDRAGGVFVSLDRRELVDLRPGNLDNGTAQVATVGCAANAVLRRGHDCGHRLRDLAARCAPASWAPNHIDGRPLLGVTCTAGHDCAVTDSSGRVFTSATPAGKSGRWLAVHGITAPVTAVSCAADGFCAAVTRDGRDTRGLRVAALCVVGQARRKRQLG